MHSVPNATLYRFFPQILGAAAALARTGVVQIPSCGSALIHKGLNNAAADLVVGLCGVVQQGRRLHSSVEHCMTESSCKPQVIIRHFTTPDSSPLPCWPAQSRHAVCCYSQHTLWQHNLFPLYPVMGCHHQVTVLCFNLFFAAHQIRRHYPKRVWSPLCCCWQL
jgi:hypothetical protein